MSILIGCSHIELSIFVIPICKLKSVHTIHTNRIAGSAYNDKIKQLPLTYCIVVYTNLIIKLLLP